MQSVKGKCVNNWFAVKVYWVWVAIALMMVWTGVQAACLFLSIQKYFHASQTLLRMDNTGVAETELMESLEELTSSWVTRSYFYEEKIYELGKRGNWEIVIQEANKALQ